MNTTNNPKLTKKAQDLRQHLTPEEGYLWKHFLKELPITFNRQKVIGSYIVDFYCAAAKLVIEIDGSQHYQDSGLQKDFERDSFLKAKGLTVLRYTNLDIKLRFKNVCEDIYKYLDIKR